MGAISISHYEIFIVQASFALRQRLHPGFVLSFTWRQWFMKKWLLILTGMMVLFLPACRGKAPACPPATGTPQYLAVPPQELPLPVTATNSSPIPMEIGGRTILVDKVVAGPLCNGAWSGVVYVSCNVQVYQWEEQPTFLKDCNLTIAPGTVVYVAYHHDTAYYNGCSCHTGETTGP
jgi:hypothetical protein